MDGQNDNRKRLATALNEVAVDEGVHQTLVDGVRVARHSAPQSRTPVVYEPMIVVVGQGRKRGYLGDDVYEVQANGATLRFLSRQAAAVYLELLIGKATAFDYDLQLTAQGWASAYSAQQASCERWVLQNLLLLLRDARR